jgi:hypothetical protein
MELKTLRAQWNPMYTEESAIVRTEENMRNPIRDRSVLESHECVLCLYWNVSTLNPSSAVARMNMMPNSTLHPVPI